MIITAVDPQVTIAQRTRRARNMPMLSFGLANVPRLLDENDPQ